MTGLQFKEAKKVTEDKHHSPSVNTIEGRLFLNILAYSEVERETIHTNYESYLKYDNSQYFERGNS